MNLYVTTVEFATAFGNETSAAVEDLHFDFVVIIAFLALWFASVLQETGAGETVDIIEPAGAFE